MFSSLQHRQARKMPNLSSACGYSPLQAAPKSVISDSCLSCSSCSKLFKAIQSYSKLFKAIQSYSKLFKALSALLL